MRGGGERRSDAAAAERVPGSYKDPAGFVFRHEGVLYRHVAASHRDAYDALRASGLYEELVEARLLVAHREVALDAPLAAGAYRVLEPEPVPFVSYPYEWCFGQLRDAALATLEIQRRALRRGMTLKDASAYNIQFVGARPVFIDTLSFERATPGAPWVAYRQFCEHFLAPLALMAARGSAGGDAGLGDLQRVHMDGIPLSLASAHLPRRTWARPHTLLHVHLHARSIQHFARRAGRRAGGGDATTGRVSEAARQGLLDSLERAILDLRWRGERSTWVDYDREHDYSDAGTAAKECAVQQWLARVGPRTVWDLGANAGRFSDLAAAAPSVQHVVAIDGDAGAVERNYQHQRARRTERVLPLRMDLTNPSPRQGWAHAERASLADRGPADAVLALALVHHLTIAANVPLPHVAGFFAQLGTHLVIEFVPKSDPQTQRLLAARADVFPHYTREAFESAFGAPYELLDRHPVPDSERTLYLMRRR